MKVSIIILNWNTLYLTKSCVRAIMKHTKMPYELIIVDNGSTERGTKEYIESVADKWVFNEKNEGIAKASNQGAKIATGNMLITLNNDTTPSYNWLVELLRTFAYHKNCGIVGPLGNPREKKLGGDTIVYPVQAVGSLKEDMRVRKLSGFCLLVPKSIHDKVGGWDEDFQNAWLVDDFFVQKIRHSGYDAWISAKSLVYHNEPSASYIKNKQDLKKMMSANDGLFKMKMNELREGKYYNED